MLEHDRRALLLAERFPECSAECTRALEPLRVLDVIGPARELAPVIELAAIDHADGAELLAELVLAVARDDGNGPRACCFTDLDRHRAEAASTAPDEDGLAGTHNVRRPAMEHAIRRRTDEHVRGRLFPRQVRRLRQALVVLNFGEL